MARIGARHRVDIAATTAGWDIAGVSIGPTGEPFVLAREPAPDGGGSNRRGGGSFDRQTGRSHRFRVHRPEGTPQVIEVPDTEANFAFVQPLGAERLLLVWRRAAGRSDTNAHIYAHDGRLVRSFHAGDGIEDVQVTVDGQIWISYFDEGVFGDDLGQAGVVCFDEHGRVTFEYAEQAERHGLPRIDDCYAMNVASDTEVWLYYYSDFPLVRLIDKQFDREWPAVPVTGSHGFAVGRSRVLFAGGYKNKGRVFSVSLDSLETEEVRVVDDAGKPLAFDYGLGRGSRLHLVAGHNLFEVDLDAV